MTQNDENENIQKDSTKSIVNLLRNFVIPFSNDPDVQTTDDNIGKGITTEQIIKNVNNKFLIETLSPQIIENETKKRHHKDILMIAVAIFLSIQFLILFVIVGFSLWSIIQCHKIGKPFNNSTIQLIFGFIGAYITSVVVELIAILKYIVTNVFDTSIASLVKIFKD